MGCYADNEHWQKHAKSRRSGEADSKHNRQWKMEIRHGATPVRARLTGCVSRAQHFDLHRGVESPPGLLQLRGKRRAELALKAPHQRLAHRDILRWLNAKSGVPTT